MLPFFTFVTVPRGEGGTGGSIKTALPVRTTEFHGGMQNQSQARALDG